MSSAHSIPPPAGAPKARAAMQRTLSATPAGGGTIPTDERLFRWLARQIGRIQRGSIQLEIEHGQIRSIGCHGHRYLDAPEALEESQDV